MIRDFRPNGRELGALTSALAGFVINVGESSSVVINGVVTSSHHYNYAAVVLGLVAIALAGSFIGRSKLAGDVAGVTILAQAGTPSQDTGPRFPTR